MKSIFAPTRRTEWNRSLRRSLSVVGFCLVGLDLAAQRASSFEAAVKPLDEGVPEIAVVRLKELLGSGSADHKALSIKMAEALIASGEPEKALATLDSLSAPHDSTAEFLRGQAMAALRRWTEAFSAFERVAGDAHSALRPAATFGAAEALRALKRDDEARLHLARLFKDKDWGLRARLRTAELLLVKGDLAGVTRLLDDTKVDLRGDRAQKRFLRGRLEAAQHQYGRAAAAFQSVLKSPDDVSHPILVAALVALADAHLALRTPEAGDDVLEDFIEHHPSDAALPAIFAKLDELYRAERKMSAADLGRWRRDSTQPRQTLAQFYFARSELRGGRKDVAMEALRAISISGSKEPIAIRAMLDLAELEAGGDQYDQANAILDKARDSTADASLRTEIEFRRGEINYRAKRFDESAESFKQAAQMQSEVAPAATYNAALSSLRAGTHIKFLTDGREVIAGSGSGADRADLLLEEGLVQASRGEKGATEILQRFTREYPTHPRVSESWVALAEIAFHAPAPAINEARSYLARASESHPTSAATERADYLTMWLEDKAPSGDADQIIRLGNEFLEKHRGSAFAIDVRMKLAEQYFRRQDFANAQTHFELLARQAPNGPLAEKALFFAAQSAMSSMGPQSLDRAIVLLDEVVRKDGELKWSARNEQAAIERKLGKDQDALVLYDEVIKHSSRPAERREALCGKGDIFTETAAATAANYRLAIAAFDELASERDASPHWRNQALFKKGTCFEKLDEDDEALATYYTAIEESGRPDRPREFFWFYKAGFSAARMLEEREKWESAASIYQRLAAAGGSRSEEAKTRLTRLRLAHFLWEQ